jgi:parallel beta-helix repeat protein
MQVVRAAAAVLALLAFALPTPASADHVRCGDVITQDTTLDSDVVCAGAFDDALTGVVIGENGVTLNLNGFTIQGPNSGEQVGNQWGIHTNGTPRRSVTIKNGAIDGFSEGLSVGLSNSKIRNLNSEGRLRLSGQGNVIRDSYLEDGDTGLEVRGDDNRVLRNTIFGGDGHGIDVSGARNQLVANTAGAFQGAGIYVDRFSDVVIKRNDVSDFAGIGDGIAVMHGSGGVIADNVASNHDSATGIYVDAAGLLIRKNEAHRNDLAGIWVRGSGNTIKQNVANDNNPESLATYGIRVEPGNIDGGGNRASGNGALEQCIGVRCK